MPLIRPDNSVPVKALLKRFALIYLPIVMVLSVALLSGARLDEQRMVERREGRESSRVEIAKGLATQEFSEVASDLHLITHLPFLNGYLDSGNPAQREELAKYFLALARESRLYDQVRYLDASGQEVIRINYNDGKPAIVPREQLQNKSERYYFRDTIRLNRNEIFVSPLDLNIEQGRLVIPYKPMIRFGIPVFDSAGRKKGVILLNYLGDKLLQNFREMMQGDGLRGGMLLNHDGYWLSGVKPEDEWGFILGKSERTFGHDFPEEWRAISASEQGTLLTNKGLFVYATVYPLLLGQRSSKGSTLVHAPGQQELTAHEYYWKIVSFVPHAVLSGAAFYKQTSSRIWLVIVYLLLALTAWTIANVTLSRAQVRAELARSKANYDELARHISVGVYLFRFHCDGSMNFEYVSPVFCQMLDLDADAVLRDANMAFATAHPDDLDSLVRSNQEVMVSLKPFRWEGRFTVRGETRWVHIASAPTPTPQPDGGSLWSGVVSDITERKQLEEELKRQARIDLLTGLNNRRHFFELAEQELARAKRHDVPLPALMLDVDHFKLVNDTYGHHVGDLVLQKLSEVCVKTLRGIDILGRLGGEEFAILLPETKSEQALEVAERLRLAVAGATVPLEQGGSIHLTVSIGVASVVATDAKIEDLLKRADTALYAAKNAGRNRVCGEGIG